jgi:tRNA threonylcarbamoyladenosine biosynthesis protein TsaE
MKKSWVCHSRSPAETKAFGQKIGKRLKTGDVVALYGELGTGKTTLVKGIARGLGIPERRVASPSFVIIHEYEGIQKVYHVDWYRLRFVGETDGQMIRECFEGQGVTLVEWANRGEALLPKERLTVRLKPEGLRSRRIEVSARGKKYETFSV